ncbi:hypothetical protein Micbo1qcDRAFT_181722 [Microdochium bolleyi]|uniref:MYB DNA-binding domain-containing protein n=1 Tax=Microdochium bolleyi TaxID=196109 RepID=A0A136JIF7_9PEZI|nr:hypothetical protein Micbo1qcDRAFT_181722 [Microdochium bolleyi]
MTAHSGLRIALVDPAKETATVDIFNLLRASDSNEAPLPSMSTSQTQLHSISAPTLPARPGSIATFSVTPLHTPSRLGFGRSAAGPGLGARRAREPGSGKRNMPPQSSESPAKKQSKWSAEEDALIIDLRGGGMKWEDISKRLPGRSAISCRLHYQNYLERRSEWDEERKNKLARLYERFKQEMWAKVAEEMAIPWRAAEAMHWQLGEADMAKRAGVTPFCLTAVNVEGQAGAARVPPSRGHHQSHSHSHSYSHTFFPREMMGQPINHGGRGPMPPTSSLPPLPSNHNRPSSSRRDSYPQHPQTFPPVSEHHDDRYHYTSAPSGPPPPPPPPPPPQIHAHGGPLPPIQAHSHPRSSGVLPSVSELTTGVSPFSTPAYSVGVPSVSPAHSGTASPGPYAATLQPDAFSTPSVHTKSIKRSRSPEFVMPAPAPSRRRQYHHLHAEHDDKSSVTRHMP